MAEKKPHINVVFIGHVDHGKSTLVGRLLYETGKIDERYIQKLKDEAKKIGKDTFEFAWVMDKLKEERVRGLTIDISHEKFETEKYFFTIIDAPGHRDFVKNMITGASQADAAVLVVDVVERDENGDLMPQTKEHVYLSKILGIDQIIVAINKMDKVNYDQKKFEETKNLVHKLLKTVGYKDENVQFVPVSALYGENIVKPSDKMPWWKGPTFIGCIDNLKVPDRLVKLSALPLRIPIQDVYSITGVGTVPVGRVETGILKVGDRVVFMPPGVVGEVKSIETHHTPIQEARPGDNIGFNVKGVSRKEIRRGDVCGHIDKPPTVVKEFTAQVIVINHPTAIAPGYTPVFHAHTASVACRIVELISKLDPRTGNIVEKAPKFIKKGEAAIVKVIPTKPLCVERFREFPPLGRFAIRDMGMTVGAGIVIEVVPEEIKFKA